jgi:MIP family channel proteins
MDDSQRKVGAEFVGTFALIFFGAGSALQGADLVGQALANGLAIGLMVTAVGHISGGHFNPAVTLSMLVTGRISPAEALRYWVSQLAGGVAAALVLLAIFPSAVTDAINLGVPAVGGHGFSTGNALVAEIVGTFFLVFVIYGVAVDKRGAFSILAGLPIGLTISIGVLAVGAVSGAAFNPARWFGPALVSGTFDNFWIWILGPAIGATLAGLAYDRLLLKGTPGE